MASTTIEIRPDQIKETIESFQTFVPGYGMAPSSFSCMFIKRSNGSPRKMTAMLGYRVKKGLKGGELSYDPDKHKLLPVAEYTRDENTGRFTGIQRRNIPLDKNMLYIKGSGITYKVVE